MQMCGHLLPQSDSIYDNNTSAIASITTIAAAVVALLFLLVSFYDENVLFIFSDKIGKYFISCLSLSQGNPKHTQKNKMIM